MNWATVIPHIGPAAAAIARYDGMLADAQIPAATASRLLTELKTDSLVLRELVPGRGRRPGTYAFPELLNIAEGKRVF